MRTPQQIGTHLRQPHVVPDGTERVFGTEEIIVSKTDTRGIIRYANDVFLRVSGYTEEEVLGRPHSLIRHPRMPRGVFHLLWSTLEQGQEIFAYIDNLAADGSHYWVLAHVTPSFGPGGRITGYHSNRRCPDRSAIAAIRPLYDRMLAEEAKHRNARDAAAASARLLHAEMDAAGTTYDRMVWDLTNRSLEGAR